MALALVAGTLVMAPAAEARITHIVVDPARSQSPTFGGLAFGTVGQYEKLRGTAFGELDPADPQNAVITDIELAPRNSNGKVEYSTDIFILKPINLKNGNHRLFIDYNNRGQMRLGRLNDVDLTNNPTTAARCRHGLRHEPRLQRRLDGVGFRRDRLRFDEDLGPGGHEPGRIADHRPLVRIHRLRQRHEHDATR